MINNIIITSIKFKDKYLIIEKNKIKKNKSFIKIIVEIKENLGGGLYLIKIIQNTLNINLKKNQCYVVNFNLLRKCDENIINKIFNYNSNINTNCSLYSDSEEKISNSDDEITIEELELSDDNDNNLSAKSFIRSKSI